MLIQNGYSCTIKIDKRLAVTVYFIEVSSATGIVP